MNTTSTKTKQPGSDHTHGSYKRLNSRRGLHTKPEAYSLASPPQPLSQEPLCRSGFHSTHTRGSFISSALVATHTSSGVISRRPSIRTHYTPPRASSRRVGSGLSTRAADQSTIIHSPLRASPVKTIARGTNHHTPRHPLAGAHRKHEDRSDHRLAIAAAARLHAALDDGEKRQPDGLRRWQRRRLLRLHLRRLLHLHTHAELLLLLLELLLL